MYDVLEQFQPLMDPCAIVQTSLHHLLLGGSEDALGLLLAHVDIVEAIVRGQGVGRGDSVRLVILRRSKVSISYFLGNYRSKCCLLCKWITSF